MSTNLFNAATSHWHERYLQGLDARTAGDAEPALRRLRGAHVSLIVDAGMAAPVLRALQGLGLGRLSVTPINVQARAALAQGRSSAADKEAVRTRAVFDTAAFTLALADVDLIAVALSRPHPQQLAAINAIAVRHGLPVCPVLLDGTQVELGPTVMPGASACLACAEVRRAANVSHTEAWEAQRQFYDRNPNVEMPGRFDSLARVAASMLGLEVEALIGGRRAPAAANRLHSYDLTMAPQAPRFIPYYEWCSVCRPGAAVGTCAPHFDAFLQRRGIATARSPV